MYSTDEKLNEFKKQNEMDNKVIEVIEKGVEVFFEDSARFLCNYSENMPKESAFNIISVILLSKICEKTLCDTDPIRDILNQLILEIEKNIRNKLH